MGKNEAVRLVFEKATKDEDFSALLWADPAEAGRRMGLSGADLHELVGSIDKANASRDRDRGTMIAVRDVVHHTRTDDWPFATAPMQGVIDRASAARLRAESILFGIAFGRTLPEHVDDIARWALALEAEIRRRAVASRDVDRALAAALIQTMSLTEAIERARRVSQQGGGS